MENKRSKGIFYWAWALMLLNAWTMQHDAGVLDREIQLFGTPLVVFSELLYLSFVICGVFLLRFNEVARRAIIYLCLVNIVLYLLISLIYVITYHSNKWGLHMAIDALFYGIPIYFFSRPNVKEQFCR